MLSVFKDGCGFAFIPFSDTRYIYQIRSSSYVEFPLMKIKTLLSKYSFSVLCFSEIITPYSSTCPRMWLHRLGTSRQQFLLHSCPKSALQTKYICVRRVRYYTVYKWKHQLDATILSVYFTAIIHSTCFGCYIHPSSGASNMYNQVWYNLITV